MAKNTGTLVSSPIRVNDSLDTYPAALANEIQGGRHSVATIALRNATPVPRRSPGMEVYVEADGKTYQLGNDLTTWTERVADRDLTSGPVRSVGPVSAVEDFSLPLRKLASSAASLGQSQVWNGTEWKPVNPQNPAIELTGVLSPAGANGVYTPTTAPYTWTKGSYQIIVTNNSGLLQYRVLESSAARFTSPILTTPPQTPIGVLMSGINGGTGVPVFALAGGGSAAPVAATGTFTAANLNYNHEVQIGEFGVLDALSGSPFANFAAKAVDLAERINSDPSLSDLVTAVVSGNTVIITAKTAGVAGNSITMLAGGGSWTTSGPTLTGGSAGSGGQNLTSGPVRSVGEVSSIPNSSITDAMMQNQKAALPLLRTAAQGDPNGTATFATGSITVTGPTDAFTSITVAGQVFTWSNNPVGLYQIFEDSPSLPSGEATKIRNKINGAGLGVTASVAGAVVTITANSTGASGNSFTLAASGQFTVSGATLTGGSNGTPVIPATIGQELILGGPVSPNRIYFRSNAAGGWNPIASFPAGLVIKTDGTFWVGGVDSNNSNTITPLILS